jgi:hypothetical protein
VVPTGFEKDCRWVALLFLLGVLPAYILAGRWLFIVIIFEALLSLLALS